MAYSGNLDDLMRKMRNSTQGYNPNKETGYSSSSLGDRSSQSVFGNRLPPQQIPTSNMGGSADLQQMDPRDSAPLMDVLQRASNPNAPMEAAASPANVLSQPSAASGQPQQSDAFTFDPNAASIGNQIGMDAMNQQYMQEMAEKFVKEDQCGSCGGGCDGGGGGADILSILYGAALCTAAANLGFLSPEILKADYNQLDRFSNSTQQGYFCWAYPLASFLNNHPRIFKWSVLWMVKAWARHMAFLDGALEKDSKLGKALEIIGVPICYCIGKLLGN